MKNKAITACKNTFSFLALILVVYVVITQPQVSQFLTKINLKKATITGYYEALNNQNLAYDFNKDGVVSGEDYPLLVDLIDSRSKDVKPEQYELTPASAGQESTEETIDLPTVSGFGSDVFNGEATVSYPIGLPPGPGSISPSLSLSYSSGAVDSLYTGKQTTYRNDENHAYQWQSSVYGLGWNLGGMGQVIRDDNNTKDDLSDDLFSLGFAGGSAKLVKESGDNNYSVWRTVPNLFIKVERFGLLMGSTWRYHWMVTTGDGTRYYFGSEPENNWCGDESRKDPDKKHYDCSATWYRLYKRNPANEWTGYGTRFWTLYNDGLTHAVTSKWMLHKVVDIFGQSVNYETFFQLTDDGENNLVRESYPYKISYGHHEVIFELEDRLDRKIHSGSGQAPGANWRLKKIIVKTLGKVRSAYTFDYLYAYDYTKHANKDGNPNILGEDEVKQGQVVHSLLERITQWSDDPATNSQAEKLPQYTFSYGGTCGNYINACPLTAYVEAGKDNQARTPNDLFLRSAENGFGGKVDFEYWDNGSGGNALPIRVCDRDKLTVDGKECLTDWSYNTMRHRVRAKIVWDGMGSFIRTNFDYTGSGASQGLAAVEQYQEEIATGPACEICSPGSTYCTWDECREGYRKSGYCADGSGQNKCTCRCSLNIRKFKEFEFLGYPEVVSKVFEKNSDSKVVAQSKAFYYQAMETNTCFKPSPIKGLAYKTITYDVNDNSKYTQSSNEQSVRFGPMFGNHEEVKAGDLNTYCDKYNTKQTVSLVLSQGGLSQSIYPNPSLCVKTSSHDFDAYGNPAKTVNWGKVDCANPSQDDTSDVPKMSFTQYTNANTGKWILPKAKESWTSNSENGDKYGHSRVYYDNQDLGVLGDRGQPSKSVVMKDGQEYASSQSFYEDSAHPWLLTKTTDTYGRTSKIKYDDIFHQYPVETTNDLGHTSKITYDFQTEGDQYNVLGLPIMSEGPNGAKAHTFYDAFGRSTKTYLPGRDLSKSPNAVTEYYYSSCSQLDPNNHCMPGLGSGNPSMATISKSLMIDSGEYSLAYTLYNGIGQQIQARQSWLSTNLGTSSKYGIAIDFSQEKKDIISTQQYNALGQAFMATQSEAVAPYDMGSSILYYDKPDFSHAGSTAFDGFGRPTVITYPDGSSEETIYYSDPTKISLKDKNCRSGKPCTLKTTYSDAFGQTLKVEEQEQPGGKIYTTSYKYHPLLGVLTETIDTLGTKVNEVWYDQLGQKTKMWDIDMGNWEYGYDKLGNLIWQKDANDNEIELVYDNLYRLTKKKDKVNGRLLLEYKYDNCNYGIGRKCQSRSFKPSNGNVVQAIAYKYDQRGQIQKQDQILLHMPQDLMSGASFSVAYQYDEGGRATSLEYPAINISGIDAVPAEIISNVYEGPHLREMKSSQVYAKGAVYNKDGQMLEFVSGNNVKNSYTYDPVNMRLGSLKVNKEGWGDQQLKLAYNYDSVGNITDITDNSGKSADDPFYLTQRFTYDALYRLTGASDAYTASYQYDDIGNILQKIEGQNTVDLAYDDLSYYHRPQSVDGKDYTYDVLGNLLQDGNQNYIYDVDNRLSKVVKQVLGEKDSAFSNLVGQEVAGAETSFLYDGEGQRISKTDSSGKTTYYISPLLELDIKGDKINWRKNYYFGGRLVAVREDKSISADTTPTPTPTINPEATPTPTTGPESTPTPTPIEIPCGGHDFNRDGEVNTVDMSQVISDYARLGKDKFFDLIKSYKSVCPSPN